MTVLGKIFMITLTTAVSFDGYAQQADAGGQQNAATGNRRKELKLWYTSEAPESCTPQEKGKTDWSADDIRNGWEDWSLPLGNGYMGASGFGGAGT